MTCLKNRIWFSTVFSLLIVIGLSSCKKESTVFPERKDIIESVYASGTIVATNEYSLYSLANGTIVKKLVRDGDTVRKGEVLYEIKSDPQQSRVATSVDALRKAESDLSSDSPILSSLRFAMQSSALKAKNDSLQLERYHSLLTTNAITRSQFETAELAYIASKNEAKSAIERYASTKNELQLARSSAQTQLSLAKGELDNYSIKAEADGIVYKTTKEIGETVRAGELLVLLGENGNKTIKLAVDEQDIDKIALGQQILLKTDVSGNKVYSAQVSQIYPLMNSADQTFRVDGAFDSSVVMPFVHHSVEANIIIQTKKNVLVIPRSTVIGTDSVMILQDGKKKLIAIKVGVKTIDAVEVTSGLEVHTEIVSAK